MDITQRFIGPDIHEALKIDGVVYASFEPFTQNISDLPNYFIEGFLKKYSNNENTSKTSTFKYEAGWPFDDIAFVPEKKMGNSLTDQCRLTEVIRDDVKGWVGKGLYLKKWYDLRKCIIKQGKRNTLSDEYRRDIKDRLHWQYEIHYSLSKFIPTPKVFALFESGGDTYLVMEHINGKSLDNCLLAVFKGHSWRSLTQNDRLLLVNYSFQLLEIAKSIHLSGYVHRDINPGNLMIEKKNRLAIIDFELAYAMDLGVPSPAFKLGTPGFMSPEQELSAKPSIYEDIYAIGATLIVIFTGLLPGHFSTSNYRILSDQLAFFLNNKELAYVISKCFHTTPKERPSIENLSLSIRHFCDNSLSSMNDVEVNLPITTANNSDVHLSVELGLKALSTNLMTDNDFLWKSVTIGGRNEGKMAGESFEVYPGLYTGVSGVLLLVSKMSLLGVNIQPCIKAFSKNLEYVLDQKNAENISNGLYYGSAGIGVAIYAAITSGLIPESDTLKAIVEEHLIAETKTDLGIATGLSGNGLALLNSSPFLRKEFAQNYLQNILDT